MLRPARRGDALAHFQRRELGKEVIQVVLVQSMDVTAATWPHEGATDARQVRCSDDARPRTQGLFVDALKPMRQCKEAFGGRLESPLG